jgi:hypothetical protein
MTVDDVLTEFDDWLALVHSDSDDGAALLEHAKAGRKLLSQLEVAAKEIG